MLEMLFLTLLQGQITRPKQAEMDGLVAQLSHQRFRIREAASARLLEMGPGALPRLRFALTEARDPEARKRLANIIAEMEARRLRWVAQTIQERYGDTLPMIDAWWIDCETGVYDPESEQSHLRHWAHACLRPYLGEWSPQAEGDKRRWGWWRDGTYRWFASMLEAGVPVPVVDLIFLEMRRRDNLWIARTPGAEPDPIHWPGVQTPPVCPKLGTPVVQLVH